MRLNVGVLHKLGSTSCVALMGLNVGVLLLHVLLLQLSTRCSAAGRAALTMFRVSTGDDWVYIMQQCGVRPPVCTVSVSLTVPTWHHTSSLGYILPAASH